MNLMGNQTKQVVGLLPRTYHLQKTVINSKFIIYIITTLLYRCKDSKSYLLLQGTVNELFYFAVKIFDFN